MTKSIEHLYNLHNNLFLLAPIVVKFYEKYEGKQPKDILLSYLIFPICLYEDSKKILQRNNKRRDLRTYINYNLKEDKKRHKEEIKKNQKLFGLPDRIDEYKEMTNLCLQYAFDRGNLKLNEDMSISYLKNDFANNNTIVEFIKASENLALMLKKDKLIHVYTKFGIKKL
ncbi:MAG: three component ABC system middle component [Flavobacteriales bacterium]|tara:strand:+ start:21247 stop:21756 length:510 start_codon:yes stop_codon:yes gene_type:complete